ncbi:MAG: glycosyltransferase family 39 protein [Bacteroidales bacterium]|nr:glycosyltransferase family 39 protein [Bacteroidales bacterium]
MNDCSKSVKDKMIVLLLASTSIRIMLAAWLELGNDEVYYWTYALFPDWSHFDHPPMVGWMMQLFSLNLYFDSELFLRLSSVVLTTINTLIIFLIGKTVRSEVTGMYAALLYTASVYAFVITGIMILPDTPQNFFWLLSLFLMAKIIKKGNPLKAQNIYFILLGLSIGLGIISKYTSVFLWFGFGLFILFYKREWLKLPVLYVSVLISAVCTLPVILWNMQNDFISFSFQGERVNIFASSFRPDLFLSELAGQILYNNPVNFVLIISALILVFKGKQWLLHDYQRLLLLIALPVIGLFLMFSMFRATLPHWTGPAYNTLLILAAARLAVKFPLRNGKIRIPGGIIAALFFLFFIITLGALQIKYALIPVTDNNPYHRLGRNDVTLDMYGWRKFKPEFEKIRNKHVLEGNMKSSDAIVGENWFPLANLDYYVARPLKIDAFGLGEPQRLHKYLWINEERGGLQKGNDYWYVTNSRDYKHPEEVYAGLFEQIIAADTVTIDRAGKPAKRFFVFLLKDLKQQPVSFLNH